MPGGSAVAIGGSAQLRLVQEPCLQVAVGLEQACEAGCQHRDIGLAHAARRHALVLRVDEDGNTARLQQLLDLGQGVNDRRDGVAALFWATYYTQPAAMRLLLGAGADPNMGDDLGFSPLHASVFDPDDCHECAQILVDANADLTYRKDGLTPLEYAKYREGRPRVVKVLEDAVAAASGGGGDGEGDSPDR